MVDDGRRFQIVIKPGGWQSEGGEAITILDAAAQNGINLPSSCRNGTCRTCICRLLSGQVRYQIEWPGLSADEKKEGYILPCVAYPKSDLVLEAPTATALAISGLGNSRSIESKG
jgi:ferredoxin